VNRHDAVLGAAADAPYVWEITTRFSDLDPLGHVNNAVYLSFTEEARTRMFREALGGVVGPLLLARSEIDHLGQAYYGSVTVGSAVVEVGRSSFTVVSVIDQDGVRVAQTRSVLVHVDDDRRPTPIGAEARAALETLQAPAG